MKLTVEPEALNKIKELRPNPGDCLRIEVRGGGCSGLIYDMSWASAPELGDIILFFGYTIIFVERKSALFLQEAVLSYDNSLTMAGFRLSSDKIKSSCGCGKSFSL